MAALVELDGRAVRSSLQALAPWHPAAGDPATPCAGWALSDLVAHMTVQHQGFARAASGERTTREDWRPVKHPEPLGAYREACEQVGAAFGRLSDPSAPVILPEVRTGGALPALMIVGFHLVDYVVHAWDAARSLGADPVFDDEVLGAALRVARAVPDDESRDRDDAAFAHALAAHPDAGALDEILLLLGRDPAWAPPVA